MFRRDSPSIRRVIRLPKVTPKNAAQAQWSDTLPQDFAETLPTVICLTEDEAPSMDGPPIEAAADANSAEQALKHQRTP